MIYKVLTMIAMMLAVAAGMPTGKRLAQLEAKVGVLKEATDGAQVPAKTVMSVIVGHVLDDVAKAKAAFSMVHDQFDANLLSNFASNLADVASDTVSDAVPAIAPGAAAADDGDDKAALESEILGLLG